MKPPEKWPSVVQTVRWQDDARAQRDPAFAVKYLLRCTQRRFGRCCHGR